jgi:hypothetical protein
MPTRMTLAAAWMRFPRSVVAEVARDVGRSAFQGDRAYDSFLNCRELQSVRTTRRIGVDSTSHEFVQLTTAAGWPRRSHGPASGLVMCGCSEHRGAGQNQSPGPQCAIMSELLNAP